MKLYTRMLDEAMRQSSMMYDSLDVKLTNILMTGFQLRPDEWAEFIQTDDAKSIIYFFYMYFSLDMDTFYHFRVLVPITRRAEGTIDLTPDFMFEELNKINAARERLGSNRRQCRHKDYSMQCSIVKPSEQPVKRGPIFRRTSQTPSYVIKPL